MIALLNKDLEWEYQATIQYIQHSAVITGAAYGAIQKELVLHATEEHTHAVSLATQISNLGGFPTIEVERRATSPDVATMLEQDLTGELYAVERYKERIRQAEEMQAMGCGAALEDILIMEEEHVRDLLSALGTLGGC